MKFIISVILLLSGSLSYSQATLKIGVEGACGMCQDRIEETALNTIGVNSASYDLDEKVLTVNYSKGLFSEMELHNNLANVGHTTEKVRAPKEIYDNLPMCCQYDYNEGTYIRGMVIEKTERGEEAIIGANLRWLNTDLGTVTDVEGAFELEMTEATSKLIVSYVGYRTDTVEVGMPGFVSVYMNDDVLLDAVEIVYERGATSISFINPLKVKEMNRDEFTKAACCNLSEAFTTNPSVDQSFTDAVTGTRQIQMLGLAGPYVQITQEGMPNIRGLNALDGFAYTPGPWIEGIQMSQGTGSVINGFESVAGQINVEMKKPDDEERLHINGYANLNGRYEGNVFASHEFNEKVSTALAIHSSTRSADLDRNDDNFLDMPKSTDFIISNRWKYQGGNGHIGQVGIKTTLNSINSGSIDPSISNWVLDKDVQRHELWLKRGYVFQNNPASSIGFMAKGIYHDLKSNYGGRRYDALHQMLYTNLLFATSKGNSKWTTGASFQMEDYDEQFIDIDSRRRESVTGLFVEYSYNLFEKLDIVAGVRGDYSNYFGLFFTPRLHLRYALGDSHVFRAVTGRGQRTATVYAENIRGLASNRQWNFNTNNPDTPYGLDAEVAWNYGLNYTYLTEINSRPFSFGVDYYFTQFDNKVVVDYDISPTEVNVSSIEDGSRSHSVQTHLEWTPVENLELRLAYRYNDVQSILAGQMRQDPLISPHRAFANIAYEAPKGWKFDYTVNYVNSTRLPITSSSPAAFQLASESPGFWMHNAQVSKVFASGLEVYLGGENLADFRQEDPIVSVDNPQNPYFDASMVWGPIFGRNVYVGFRYVINK